MTQEPIDYSIEFDESVIKYNEWLVSLESPKVQKQNKYWAFLRGMGSILDIFKDPFNIQTQEYLLSSYPMSDLSAVQKDVIALASDWKRVDMNLDRIISGESSDNEISVGDARDGKKFVQHMYDHYKNVYVSSKKNKNN